MWCRQSRTQTVIIVDSYSEVDMQLEWNADKWSLKLTHDELASAGGGHVRRSSLKDNVVRRVAWRARWTEPVRRRRLTSRLPPAPSKRHLADDTTYIFFGHQPTVTCAADAIGLHTSAVQHPSSGALRPCHPSIAMYCLRHCRVTTKSRLSMQQ